MKAKNTVNHQKKVEKKLSNDLAKSCKKNLPISKGGRVFHITLAKTKS